jgi:hypothetical protein
VQLGVVERNSVQGAGPKEVQSRNDRRFSDFPVTNRGPELIQTDSDSEGKIGTLACAAHSISELTHQDR